MSNPIKFFGLRGSVFTRYALFALDEVGVQYDMTIVPLDQFKSAENLARHPFGKFQSFKTETSNSSKAVPLHATSPRNTTKKALYILLILTNEPWLNSGSQSNNRTLELPKI